jgi:hypothetical protein
MNTRPAELSRKNTLDCGNQQPMTQQDVADTHGHEMHPQKFVRLVGCHDSNADKHDAGHRLH